MPDATSARSHALLPATIAGALSLLATATAAAADAAADYPQKSIRMIVAFAPGGGTDIVGRIAAKGISDNLGQQVVVDNRTGAGGNIGTEIVAKSAPDGYTLITGGTGSHAINPSLYAKIPYDAINDFSPVCLVASTPYLMVVNQSVPARSVKQFIDLAKSSPGKINMASSGSGGMPHLAGELFKMMTGVQMTHIPYKGTGAVFTDLMGGGVQVLFGDIVATYPHVKGERLRALGITSPKRAPGLPDIPTIAESGVPGYDAVGWFGVFAPARTPKIVITKLHGAIVKYVTQPELKERFAALGADVVASTPEQFAQVQKADLARWAKVVKESGARVE
jgi:tripartite-type tricarboxylate transporter receptor subunit TctC